MTTPARELAAALVVSVSLAGLGLGVEHSGVGRPCASAALGWLLVGSSVFGTHLAGRDVAWGWLLLVGLQPLWIGYAIATEQYGFALGAVAYGLGQLRGFLRSRRDLAPPPRTGSRGS